MASFLGAIPHLFC